MSDTITIDGGRIFFQGYKIAAIYKDIPASVREDFETKIESFPDEGEFEDE